jgi:iron complex outermembrane receptor protein
MKQRKLSLLIATTFAMPFLTNLAFAQQTSSTTPPPEEIQQVQVVGISAAAQSALDAKQSSNNMIESIVAEDIGKLPDTTIAESLSRLPGLNSGIDRGNSSQVVAEGLGPRFIAATLNGRELATPEPNRAIRFEQFPSESLVGANIYKTQSAELIEGGMATTIDLLTVRPLQFKEQQLTLKADYVYDDLGDSIQGAKKTGPRIGGMWLDQFLDKTLGVAFAFSYEDQPSLVKDVEQWGYNTASNSTITSNGQTGFVPWGFQDEAKRGTDQRISMLGKVEWKADSDTLITGDAYYERQDIFEPGLQTYTSGMGNWGGGTTANYTNLVIQNGYVVGGSASGMGVQNNDYEWVQNSSTLATGLNAKLNRGGWKIDADLSNSLAMRNSEWRDLAQSSLNPATITWYMPGNGVQNFSFGQNTGDPSIYGTPTLNVNTYGNVKDDLGAAMFSASHPVTDFGDVSLFKFGVRLTDRQKSYNQVSWSATPNSPIPDSDYSTVNVGGMPPFIALNNFDSTVYSAFGSNIYDPSGRTPSTGDLTSGWTVKEKTESIFAQADLNGKMFGLDYRGNVGLRVANDSHTSDGMQSTNGDAPTPISVTATDTEFLPSLNLVYMLDPKESQQVRFGLSRAMSRAPLDELRSSQNIYTSAPGQPVTGSAGNPLLKPMLDDQIDLAYQWYFAKGSLFSTNVFFKKMLNYIKIEDNPTTVGGETAMITQSVNSTGGEVRGIEFVYQQAFTGLPAPFNGLGMTSNFSYTTSNITEQVGTGTPFPVDGLMRDNGGFTVWYVNSGFEARLSVNHHSAFTRDPTWTTGAFVINEAETHVNMQVSQQISKQFSIHFGIQNLTDQKMIFTTPNVASEQQVWDFGRVYNVGISYKM